MDAMSVIGEKEVLIDELGKANKELVTATITYKEVQSGLWLNTDFESELGKKRPTVDEKKAYVSYHSLEHRKQREIAEYNKELILAKIKLCDDKLGVL